jgi:hypothetical protein
MVYLGMIWPTAELSIHSKSPWPYGQRLTGLVSRDASPAGPEEWDEPTVAVYLGMIWPAAELSIQSKSPQPYGQRLTGIVSRDGSATGPEVFDRARIV